uniref:Uncharacterized protein n=1 Tax=Tetraselmis sp. GSL018 TaxID=582737 RepID=A0A061QN09_9CHLO
MFFVWFMFAPLSTSASNVKFGESFSLHNCSLIGTGSHRKLYLNVTATLTPEGVDNFQQLGTTCRAKVQLELPPGLFFDGYEVEREAAVRDHSILAVFGANDLESPEQDCESTKMLLEFPLPTIPSSDCVLSGSAVLPVHSRYPAAIPGRGAMRPPSPT